MSRVARFIDSALAVSSYISAGINITLINPGRLLIDLTYYFFTYNQWWAVRKFSKLQIRKFVDLE